MISPAQIRLSIEILIKELNHVVSEKSEFQHLVKTTNFFFGMQES